MANPFEDTQLAFYAALLPDDELAGAYVTAVSYTHLRAHETVLDLVCRLLLEKNTYDHNSNLISTVTLRSPTYDPYYLRTISSRSI